MHSLISISGTIVLEQPGQGVLQECWGSAQRWLTSISAAKIGTPERTIVWGGVTFWGVEATFQPPSVEKCEKWSDSS